MPRRPPQEIIDANKNHIEMNLDGIDEKPVNIRSAYMIGFGSGSENIALEYLLIDKPEESTSWFEKSANYYYSGKKLKDNYKDELEGECADRKFFAETLALTMLMSAILSENHEIMTKISKNVLEIPPHKTHNNHLTFDYVKSLALFILNSPDFYPSQINKFKELEDKYAKRFSGGYNGVAKSLLAIYNNEDNNLMEGINQILRQFFYRIKKSKETPICQDAIMLLKLAEIKGMKINLDEIELKYQKYVPRCLFEI